MSSVHHKYTALENVLTNQPYCEAIRNINSRSKRSRVFIISSNTLSTKTDCVSRLTDQLGNQCVGFFDSIRAHTPRKDVLDAIVAARHAKADTLIAIGGGSIIDAAKAVQLALNHSIQSETDLLEYAQMADGFRGSKVAEVLASNQSSSTDVRIIAVPTTLSGAEFSNTAGVLDIKTGSKEGYRAPELFPQTIIYDPSICLHTPEWLWLSTAIRSVDHAIEGYCSPKTYPFLEGQFLHALKLFSSSLRDIKSNPKYLSARNTNQQAVWLACCGLGKVTHGASHGIGYILGSLCNVPHGYTSCVMLPAVLKWNELVNHEKQNAIATALGNPDLSASIAVKQLVEDLGLPSSLRDVGVKEDQLEEIAKRAVNHSVVKSNPRAITSSEDVMEILNLAWD